MTKVKNLTREDLMRWRICTADKELVDLTFPGISPDEARKAILNYYKILGDLIEDLGLQDSKAPIHISAIDGGVYLDLDADE